MQFSVASLNVLLPIVHTSFLNADAHVVRRATS
jgi:hypothetical protein